MLKLETHLLSLLLVGIGQTAVVAQTNTPPQAQIANGAIHATLNLPDPERGYYRGGRFDWSGVIANLEVGGHSYFGVWFPKYEPTLHDAITGPVEEFRSADGGLGYAEAAPNDYFVKIGVGILRKLDNEPYAFARPYPIAGTGKWIVRPEADRVRFTQELTGVRGYSYVYTKTVRLAGRQKPDLILEHTLKNTGKRPIDTEVYNHDFYVIDNQPTGPDFTVTFPFTPVAKDDLKDAAQIRGKQWVYDRVLGPQKDTAASYLEGYGPTSSDTNIKVENTKTKAGVQETIDRPISKLYLWSIRTTICPEAYIALHIAPGKQAKWKTTYHFYKLPG